MMLDLDERGLSRVWLHRWTEGSARLRVLSWIGMRAALMARGRGRHGMVVLWMALLALLAGGEVRIGLRWAVLLLLLLLLLLMSLRRKRVLAGGILLLRSL